MNKLFIVIILFITSFSTAARAQDKGYQVGSKVEDFSLKNIDNKNVSLRNYNDAKGFIVVFTCNTCPYAKAYEQRVIDLDTRYAKKGFPVIAINPNDAVASPGDSFSAMQKRAADKKYSFPYLLDPDQISTRKFGAVRTPHIYIVSKSANGFKVEYIGAIDDDTEDTNPDRTKYAENAIDALLMNKAPLVTATKAVGCTIKWKKAI